MALPLTWPPGRCLRSLPCITHILLLNLIKFFFFLLSLCFSSNSHHFEERLIKLLYKFIFLLLGLPIKVYSRLPHNLRIFPITLLPRKGCPMALPANRIQYPSLLAQLVLHILVHFYFYPVLSLSCTLANSYHACSHTMQNTFSYHFCFCSSHFPVLSAYLRVYSFMTQLSRPVFSFTSGQ